MEDDATITLEASPLGLPFLDIYTVRQMFSVDPRGFEPLASSMP